MQRRVGGDRIAGRGGRDSPERCSASDRQHSLDEAGNARRKLRTKLAHSRLSIASRTSSAEVRKPSLLRIIEEVLAIVL